jgi:adenine-specific DNA-methyltransferase
MESNERPRIRKPPLDEDLLGFAREMRANDTDAEKPLWRILRNRKLGGFKFRRQVPIGRYIVDFYCHEGNLVVESDGGQHSEPEQLRYDNERTEFLRLQGIRVLRFWDHDILKHTDAVREQIYRYLTEETRQAGEVSVTPPHPSPLPEGEGAIQVTRQDGNSQP